ncbi:MAG TPA: tetratricopeptide repeat protein, partial [Longimicrobiales bacterium]|nr:tetratricopeptide repeat protein [Longimicrobiales bacterium]
RWTATMRARIGEFYMSQGRYREAEAALIRAVADLRAAGGSDDSDVRRAEESLQELRRLMGSDSS